MENPFAMRMTDSKEGMKGPEARGAGPSIRRWLTVPLLALPLLGLAFFGLAPWLIPGEQIQHYPLTPPHPVEVGDRLVGPAIYTLEARSLEQWTFFDFSRGSVVNVPHQFDLAWDLAFQRHKIIANGGATNPKGRGVVLNLGAVDFASLTEAPLDGYIEDTIAAIRPDRIETENLAIKTWYRYNFLTHLLRPHPNLYAVRTADGKFAKLRLLSYYCGGGDTSGCFTLEYVYQGDGSRRLVRESGS